MGSFANPKAICCLVCNKSYKGRESEFVMGIETNPRVVSVVDFKCYGAYPSQPGPGLFPAQMILYDNGEHLTDCSSLGDKSMCQFKRGTLDEIVCPFLHER